MIDCLFRSLGIQDPDLDSSQKDKVILGVGVQIPRPHHRSLAVKKINPIAADPKSINRPSIVVLKDRRRRKIQATIGFRVWKPNKK